MGLKKIESAEKKALIGVAGFTLEYFKKKCRNIGPITRV
jgi:hypothetical protein